MRTPSQQALLLALVATLLGLLLALSIHDAHADEHHDEDCEVCEFFALSVLDPTPDRAEVPTTEPEPSVSRPVLPLRFEAPASFRARAPPSPIR